MCRILQKACSQGASGQSCRRVTNCADFTRSNAINLDVFLKYFPSVFDYYQDTLEQVCSLVPGCNVPSNDLPFASYTLNVGKQCTCNNHVDACNLACGLCMVCPFGHFDHKKGGHLIMHELKLVLSVPSGSIVYFPSALISHENIPIAAGETRQAFTAFSPATLFQWADNGYSSVDKTLTKLEKQTKGKEDWTLHKSRFCHLTSFF